MKRSTKLLLLMLMVMQIKTRLSMRLLHGISDGACFATGILACQVATQITASNDLGFAHSANALTNTHSLRSCHRSGRPLQFALIADEHVQDGLVGHRHRDPRSINDCPHGVDALHLACQH